MKKKRKWYKLGYIHEIIFFIVMFILTMLHEWIKIDTITSFIKGLVFFLILYGHAQFHRFFVFPLLLTKQYGIYTLAAILSVLAGSLLLYIVNSQWINPEFYQEVGMIDSIIYHFVTCIISAITIMSLSLIRQSMITRS